MATDGPGLLDTIADRLDHARVPFALIGAAAMARHGVSRSTLDIDLLVTSLRVLDRAFWTELPAHVSLDVRAGDADDPLAGVVRATAPGERDVDVVVGRGGWEAGIVARALPVRHGRLDLPTARVEDLILLKLYAGGSQDRWDVEQLIEAGDRAAIVEAVERSISHLPLDVQRLWRRLAPRTGDDAP